MSHPLLKLELRARYRGKSRAALVGLLLVAWSYATTGLVMLYVVSDPPALGQAVLSPKILHRMLMAELALVVVVPPLLALHAIAREHRDGTLAQLLLGPWRGFAVVVSKLVLPALVSLALITECTAALLTLRAFHGGVAGSEILLAQLPLTATALAYLALGALCGTLVRDPASAVGLYGAVALALAVAPVTAGPIVERASSADVLIQSSLLVSPIVSVGSAAGMDVMRTRLLYQICPIGRRRFAYPSPGSATLFQLTSFVVFLAGSVRWTASRRQL